LSKSTEYVILGETAPTNGLFYAVFTILRLLAKTLRDWAQADLGLSLVRFLGLLLLYSFELFQKVGLVWQFNIIYV
jgi:hypothetical protein